VEAHEVAEPGALAVSPALTGRYLPGPPRRELPFWHAHELVLTRCGECGLYLHPPLPRCRRCRSDDMHSATVPGRGVIWSFTVNHQPWDPDLELPYVVAVVELDVQPGLRLLSTIVDATEDQLAIGVRVMARHVPVGDLVVPVFALDTQPVPPRAAPTTAGSERLS
jgi:uncharacterized OB-fold protein